MELFLSYSRRDSAMGDRLRDDLESAGHQVWLDRDDIRGGDQWRASIANGIAAADRVLLLMSQDSMQSENVAREISIAQDLDKTILPIVLETAEVPPEFQFLLAGVQTMDFEGRPYRVAFAELLEDLARPKTTSGSAATPPGRTRSRTGRTWLKSAGALITVGALTVIGLNQQSDDPNTSVVQADTSHDTTAATPAPGQRTIELGGSAWLAGVEFSPTQAVHDPTTGDVDVDYQVDVTQTETRTWYDLHDSLIILMANGLSIGAQRDSGEVPGLGPARVTMTYCCADADADFSDATLVFGQPSEQRWTLPATTDAVGDGVSPIHLDATGRVEAEGLYFDITGIDLVPWSCLIASDGDEALRGETVFAPVGEDRLSVLLTGTMGLRNGPEAGNEVGSVSLTQPNANQTASVGSYRYYTEDQSASQVPLCFLVDAPGIGDYRLNWSSFWGGTDSYEFTIS